MSEIAGSTAPGGRVTLLAVARDLGVSRATVSNAYNRPDQLSPALRERILARAAEMGFSGPDPMARGLRRGRVGAVGVLVDEGLSYAFSDPTAVLFLDGLAREVQADGLGLLLHAGPGAEGGAAVEAIRNAAVDAWVVQSLPDDHPAVAAARSHGRPVVVLDQPVLPGVPVVGIDDEAGAAAAVQHLAELGHRRLAVLAMPLRADRTEGVADLQRQQQASYHVIRRRLAGAAGAVAAAGLRWADVPVMECAANDPDAGARGAARLLAADRPTAIVCLSDQLALGALRSARAAGVVVPDQLSVIGFDDSPVAPATAPPLTTIGQPLRGRGEVVGSLIRALLAGEAVAAPAPYPVQLVVRGSTAPVDPSVG
jgi:DNA-binding LacI/PurR family transcriptional regulator